MAGGKQSPLVTLDCTLKLIKKEKARQLYEIRGPKIVSRLSLVVYEDITPWGDRVQLVDAKSDGPWELPALGPVTPPTAVLIRPDGYVAWVGDLTQLGLADALTTWFGPPTVAQRAGFHDHSVRRPIT